MIKIHILHHTFMIYVIHAIMCILTGENQIQNGFGLLKVNVFFYIWYHLTFILQVPYKKIDENIYIHSNDIFVTGGEQSISLFVITQFLQGEENITYLLQMSTCAHKASPSKRGRMFEHISMKTFVKIKFIWSSNT